MTRHQYRELLSAVLDDPRLQIVAVSEANETFEEFTQRMIQQRSEHAD